MVSVLYPHTTERDPCAFLPSVDTQREPGRHPDRPGSASLIDRDILAALLADGSLSCRALAGDLRKFERIARIDTEMALIRARLTIETILRNTSVASGHNPGVQASDVLLRELARTGVVPAIIERHCRVIMELGSLAAPDLGDSDAFTDPPEIEVDLCARSLLVVARWFLARPRPEALDPVVFRVIQRHEIDRRRLVETAKLDAIVYPTEFCGDPDIMLGWHEKNPDIYTLVVDTRTDRVVGCITAIPLEPEMLALIESGSVDDTRIPSSSIRRYEFPDFYRVHIASVEVHPSYQGTSVFRLMCDAFMERLLSLARLDIFVSEIIADAITPQGRRLAEFIGMAQVRETMHGSTIYKGTLLPPSFRALSPPGKALLTFYQHKYAEFRALFESTNVAVFTAPCAGPISEGGEGARLTHDMILEVHRAALSAGLAASRDALLSGLSEMFVETLRTGSSPAHQLLADLQVLNRTTRLIDDTIPLAFWLKNAAHLTSDRLEAGVFRRALAAILALPSDFMRGAPTESEPAGCASPVSVIP